MTALLAVCMIMMMRMLRRSPIPQPSPIQSNPLQCNAIQSNPNQSNRLTALLRMCNAAYEINAVAVCNTLIDN